MTRHPHSEVRQESPVSPRPASVQRPASDSLSPVVCEVSPPRFPHEFPAGRRWSVASPCRVPGGQPDPTPTNPEQRVARVLALVDAPVEPEWVRSAVEGQQGQLHVLAAVGAALAAVAGQAYAVCGHRLVVQFDEDSGAIRIRPHLVRVLEIDQPSRAAHIITQLWDLLPAIGESHER